MHLPSTRSTIDRAAEKEIFKTLLKLTDDARVLAIRDKGGNGQVEPRSGSTMSVAGESGTSVHANRSQRVRRPHPFRADRKDPSGVRRGRQQPSRIPAL